MGALNFFFNSAWRSMGLLPVLSPDKGGRKKKLPINQIQRLI